MANVTKVLGVDKFIHRLRQHKKKAAFGVQRGLKRAGLFIQRESMELVPVETGHLRAGAFTRAEGSGMRTVVTVGYVADYAIFVHEDMEAAHGTAFNIKYAKEIKEAKWYSATRSDPDGDITYWLQFHARGPDQRAKFLSTPIETKSREIRMIVQDSVDEALKL